MEFTFEQSGFTVTIEDEFEEWARLYHTIMLDANELTHITAMLTAHSWQPGEFVVEIGAYQGASTVIMAKVLERLRAGVPILSIDPFDRYKGDPYNPDTSVGAYLHSTRANQVEDICLPMVAYSAQAARLVQDRVGVLIIDGDHHYSVVRADLEQYVPKVVPGGWIFIDDYGGVYQDVVRATDEYLAEHRDLIIHAKSYFVVLQRPAATPARADKAPPAKKRQTPRKTRHIRQPGKP